MTVPFPDLDPYETLNVDVKATEAEIRKSYRKLCLAHHPDKSQFKSEAEQAESQSIFDQVQFAHMILSDPKKRKRYDDTGSLEDIGDSEFDWFEYFSSVKAEITEESIAKDKSEYQGSLMEEEDVIESWVESKGNFLYLFESIPHTEVTEEDEKRLYDTVTKLIKANAIESSLIWEKYQKKRKSEFKKFLKSQKSEAKEAEELKKEIAGKKKLDTEDDLRQLIQNRKKQSMEGLISRLESKYSSPKKKSKTSKKTKKNEYEIDDDEFERIQKKMKK